jgi:hypothetical protein
MSTAGRKSDERVDARRAVAISTTSAQTAWEYANGGWRCEGEDGKPLPLDLLETFARAENEANSGDVFAGHPAICTEPD